MTTPELEGTLEAVLEDLGRRAARGERVAILWDMDGTLVDTRLRMLTAVHAYGRTDVRLEDVSPSWQETAGRLGLDPERFRVVWQRVFWAYESFDADTELEATAEYARRAEALGIETIIVTGRVAELGPVTDRQLRRLRLQPTRVFLKPTTDHQTPAVKAEVITQLAQEGIHLGAFVTDSPEEIAEVRRRAPQVPCIFVSDPSHPTPPGAAAFPLKLEHSPPPSRLLFAQGAREPIQFGFEAEYEIEAADALLLLYAPPDVSDWPAWTPADRAAWVRAQFPVPHSEDFPLAVVRVSVPDSRGGLPPSAVRTTEAPELAFLPGHLVIDSDGNVEVVSRPTESLDELWAQIETLEEVCGPALLQITLSWPSHAAFQQRAWLDGFLAFHALLDGFERMAVGHALACENPDRDVLLPFFHPWLGPLTAGKQRFLRTYLEHNERGERLDEKWRLLVTRAFSSFKYIGGSAYRPALAGRDRVALEIRDGHRNKALLAQRLARNAACLVAGLEPFAPFAETWAFDSERDYERLPADVRQRLESAVPSRERPEIDHMYSAYDRVALQVYRHFALPLKDYSDVERALGVTLPNLRPAQEAYLERLRQVAGDGRKAQAALAAFAVESGLSAAMEAFSRRLLDENARRDVERLVPPAGPRTSWGGSLERRLQRLQARWPAQVTWRDKQLCLSVQGLDRAEKERLVADYLDAMAADTLSLRATDQGVLELRQGSRVFLPGESEPRAYEPRWELPEPVLSLTPLQNLALRRRLAAHDPCEWAAVRVSASGWFRHLPVSLSGETMERWLGLPEPGSIETAAQVVGRLLTGPVVFWTQGPPVDFPRRQPASTLASGFSSPDRTPWEERLRAFVARWPGHARLVEDVPFQFGRGSQQRRVLVLAMAGLADTGAFGRDYVASLGCDTISFPLREGAEHLRTRIGALTFALSPEGMRVNDYQVPGGRRRLEPVVTLQPDEVARLRRFAGAIVDDTLGQLGPITLGEGLRQLGDGGQHNCTTWITLAPLGANGETLATLTQMPDHWTSHDNPGWWSMFLTGASRSPRTGTVVYWTDRALADEPCAPGLPIPWDFNPK